MNERRPDRDRNADMKRGLRWLIAFCALGVALFVSLTLYLWAHSPQPP